MATTMTGWRPVRTSLSAGFVALVVAAQAAVGLLAVRNPTYAVLAAGVLVGGLIALFSPLSVAAVAFPATIATWRLGGAGVNLSYADALLVLSTVLALPFAPWSSKALRRLLGAAFLYFVILAVTLIANPSLLAVVELFHRVELVGGSLIVGSAVAAAGKSRLALRLLVLSCATLAAAAIVYTLSHDLDPAYPFNIDKNAAGFLLTAALLLLVVAPDRVEVPRAALMSVQALFLAGLVACQSRASAATFMVVLFVAVLRRQGARALLPVIGTVALLAMIWTTSQDLTDHSASARFNSVNTRIEAYDSSLELWAEQPIFGLGLRYFKDPAMQVAEPHSVIVSSLGESGLVGIVGLAGLLVLVTALLRRRRDSLSRLALLLVVAQFINALADIYWVAGRGTLPWLIVGLAVGATFESETRDDADAARLLRSDPVSNQFEQRSLR